MNAPSTEWGLLPEAYIVTLPSIHVATGELGPAARLVVATEARAKEICESGPKKDGVPIRTYRRATEADLTPTEIAGLKRAKAEAEAAASAR